MPKRVDRRLFVGGGAGTLLASDVTLSRSQPVGPTKASKMSSAAPPRLSETISIYVDQFDLSRLPPIALDRARVAFADTIGVMLAGTRSPPARIAFDMIRAEEARPVATMVGQTLQTSVQLAAFGNAIAAHGMDYDFTYLQGQTVASLIPALLPVAEKQGSTSSELLAAFVIGFEIASRLARACPGLADPGGWHSVGMIGNIATAVACAKLLKASTPALPHVVGISTSLASGLEINFGTMTKPLHAGNAARNGVLAATLGLAGFTAKETALEGENGYFAAFARNLSVDWEPFADLGRQIDLAEIGYKIKPYPCGGLGHTAIDAALAIRESLGSKVAGIAKVDVGATQYAAKLISSAYPTTVENAKFSLSYLVAYSLLHGAPTIATFTEAAINDEATRALAGKVSGHIDPEFGALTQPTPSRVTVTLDDGQSLERKVIYPLGSPQAPMTDARIEAKFLDCAQGVVDTETAERILAATRQLGIEPSLAGLWPLLRSRV